MPSAPASSERFPRRLGCPGEVGQPRTSAIEQRAERDGAKLAVVPGQQLSLLDRVGSGVIGVLEVIGAVATFGGRVLGDAVCPPYEPREILRHVFQFGYRSAPLILVAGLAIGIVLSMHTRASLERFGAEAMIPAGLAIALIRETGPLTAGLLVAGRVGAGIGAEIGAMKVTEQIDALEANAVDAFKYLAVTRILALMIVMPLLTIMMDFAGIFGGYIAEAAVSGMSWQVYFERAFSYISYSDIIPATLKTIVFGYVIAVVSTYLGFTTSRGTEGVGEASTRSVVIGSMLIIVSDVLLVKIIFFFYPSVSG
jgi:phospholipid/cholesterol/gamma-HCH transport system permease protein